MADGPAAILFFVDEMLPARQVRALLTERGHTAAPVTLTERDPAILAAAEEAGAVVLSSDHWFYGQLRRGSKERRARFHRAGTVRLPGEWDVARRQLAEWMPVIEAAFRVVQRRDDKRLVIWLRGSTLLIDE